MVVDTSAFVAILLSEPDADKFRRKLFENFPRRLSSASYLELCMVMSSRAPEGIHHLDNLLNKAEVDILPFTVEDARLARDAFLRYGKGRDVAALNFGDCFSYALAKRLNEPLLFKGDDFSKTDILTA